MGLGWIMNKVRSGWGDESEQADPALAIEQPPSLPWEDHAIVAATRAAMRSLGFQDIGAFRLARDPKIQLLAAYFPQAHFYAMTYPPAGELVPVELCCQFDEMSGISVTNSESQPTWHESPGNTTVRMAQANLDLLFSALLERTAGQDRLPTSSETFVSDFQRALTRRVEWERRKELALKTLAERKAAA